MYQTKVDNKEDEVLINIENKIFSCSRKKLSENSDYFNAMFNGNFTEKNQKNVSIQEINVNAFKIVLSIIDKKCDNINSEQMLQILQCTCMLQFEKIKNDCVRKLTEDIRIGNCLEIWNVTEFLDIHPLCEFAKCRSLLEFNKIRELDCFLQIDIKQLHSYLANVLICCDNELDIFESGMKWWYENSIKLKNSEDWTEEDTKKYLLVILSCVDFKSTTSSTVKQMLTYPDTNKIKDVLNGILRLMSNAAVETVDCHARRMFFNKKSRHQRFLSCIITSEIPRKKSIIERKMNLSYYDPKTKTMKYLFGSDSTFFSKCVPSLQGCKIVPYKQNLLLIGGEYFYGSSNWNSNIWMFHTFTNKWELLTKMPKERRHFKCIIIDEKLFIIGGTGKFRIKFGDDIMFYDFEKDTWEINIQLPQSWYEVNVCEYNKQLFLLPSITDYEHAFLFYNATKGWLKLNMDFKIPNNLMLFSGPKTIYVIDSNFSELKISGLNVVQKSISPSDVDFADVLSYYFNHHSNELFVFTKHDSDDTGGQIFQLHCFNVKTKKNQLIIQIKDSADTLWHINRGCFQFFHYSLTETVECITDFVL